MDFREAEARLLDLCVSLADGRHEPAMSAADANAVSVAAMLARTHHPLAAERLRRAADAWFETRPEARHLPSELVRRGTIGSFPRFRAMLDARLYTR